MATTTVRGPHRILSIRDDGCGGDGITFSAVAALMLRDEFLGRTHPDLGLFAFDRPSAKSSLRRWLGLGV